jgi:replicative DNA helicase
MDVVKERVPPHDDVSEQAVLAAFFIDSGAIDRALEYVRPEDFYSNANKRIFKAILNLYNDGQQQIEEGTVRAELQRTGEFDESRDTSYIASLTNVIYSAANVESYAKVVQDCALRRSLIKLSSQVNGNSYDKAVDSRVILEETQQRILELSEQRQTISYKSISELIPRTFEVIEKLYYNKAPYTGVPSGFEDLDNLTSGFQPSELIVLGARPSIGKTAFALNMAANITVKYTIPAAFFSLEMSDLALGMRLISSDAKIESEKIRKGFITVAEYDRLAASTSRLYDAPLYIVDTPSMKLLDLRLQARRLRMQHKIQILFIDYLTLVSSENTHMERHLQIAEISRSLKSLARELDIPVVALSQLRRDAEGKRPNLADLRESGSIEQDADLVMFLHRERESDRKPGDENEGNKTELIIAKQRNGPVGTIELAFLPKYATFAPLDKYSK